MTDPGRAYEEGLVRIADRIRAFAPPDLVERFLKASGFDASSFQECTSACDRTVTAVDGSNALILNAGSFTIAALRAVASCYTSGKRTGRTVTPLQLVSFGTDETGTDYCSLFEDCFGYKPGVVLDDDPAQSVAVIRDTLEYGVALEMAHRMGEGDLLLIDGALRVSHASHDAVLVELLKVCDAKGILLAAVTKSTSLTWGDGHPIVPAVAGLAGKYGVHGPWYTRLPADGLLLDRQQRHLWQQRGVPYIALLHQRSQRAFKVDLPQHYSEEKIRQTFSALAAYADDGRVTGYPYPLLDAHLTARITIDVVERITHDIVSRMERSGMSYRDYRAIFGDYHDELNRY
jgi:hypothetical protein